MSSPAQPARPASGQRTRQQPDVRRRALLDATVASLAEDGAVGASTRVIAARAGVAPGLLAYHFGSKERMLEEAYRHLSDTLAEAGRAAVAAAGDSPREQLRAFLGAGFQPPFFDEQQLTARVVLWSIAATEPGLHAVHEELYRRYRGQLTDHIAPLAPGGVVDPRLVFAVSALLDGLWLEASAGETGYDPAAMIDTCVEMIEAALGVSPG